MNVRNLKLLHTKLIPGGFLEIATDFTDYYQKMKEAFCETENLWTDFRESENERILKGELKTNYEMKYEAAGRVLHYMELRK